MHRGAALLHRGAALLHGTPIRPPGPAPNGRFQTPLPLPGARSRNPPACHDAGWPGYGRPQISGGRVPSAGWDNRACIGVQLDPSLTRRADGEAPPNRRIGPGGLCSRGGSHVWTLQNGWSSRFGWFWWYLIEMSRVCTVCTHPQAAAVDEALAAGTSYRQVAASWGLKLSAVFRHAKNHLTDPIQRRPCDICGQPLVADEQRRHAGCRKLAQRRAAAGPGGPPAQARPPTIIGPLLAAPVRPGLTGSAPAAAE